MGRAERRRHARRKGRAPDVPPPGAWRADPRLHRLLRALVIGVPAALAVAPPVLLFRAMARDAVNLPLADEWTFAGEVVRARDGTLSAADLWAQHNEHRVPAAKLVLHGLAAATDWDLRAGIAANAVVAAVMVAVAAWLVVRTVRPVVPLATGLLVLVASAAICSLAQWQNWTWSWQLTVLLGEAAGLLAAAALVRAATPGTRAGGWAVAAMLAALIGAFSNGGGLVLLLLVPLALLALQTIAGRPSWAAVAAAALVSGAAIAAYAIGWQPAAGQSPRTPLIGHVGELSAYALRLLGGPVAVGDVGRAWRSGAAALAALVASVAFVWWRAPARRTAMLPWALLGAYAAGAAALTATGRLTAGANTALMPRYATFATPLWVAVGPAIVLALASVPAVPRTVHVRRVLGAGALLAGALAAWHGGQTAWFGDRSMAARAAVARRAAACVLADPAHAPDECFRSVCWDAAWARGNATALQAHGLGPWAARTP